MTIPSFILEDFLSFYKLVWDEKIKVVTWKELLKTGISGKKSFWRSNSKIGNKNNKNWLKWKIGKSSSATRSYPLASSSSINLQMEFVEITQNIQNVLFYLHFIIKKTYFDKYCMQTKITFLDIFFLELLQSVYNFQYFSNILQFSENFL